jgi:ABC-2 type transport system permease protein
LYPILAILAKELKILTRDRQALALLFAMPAFFILVMSFSLEGVFEAGSRARPFEIAVVNRDPGPLSREILSDLKEVEGVVLVETVKGAPLTIERAEELVREGSYPLALLIPEGFSNQVLTSGGDRAEKATVTFIHDPGTNTRILSGIKGTLQGIILRRTLLAALPERLKKALVAAPFSPPGFPPSQGMEKQLDQWLAKAIQEKGIDQEISFLSRSPRGYASGRMPSATEQNVPAYTIFGVFFIVLTLASSFIQEKKEGTFQRILSAPLSKSSLLAGKLLPYFFVNLVQIALMFAVGVIFFGMKLGNLPALVLVSIALALAANGLGLLVASLGKTEAQVNSLSVFLAITLGALGGMMVPAYIMPGFMKTLSLFTPHAWALAGYQGVIVRGLGVSQILPEVGVLMVFAGSFFVLALSRFRFH